MSARHKARRAIFSLLFEAEQRGQTLSQALALFDTRQAAKAQPLAESDFIRTGLVGIDANQHEIDARIDGVLTGWTLSRLFAVDRAILRLATWELQYTDTPHEVVRSEALALAAEYGSEDATKFIGGVLGSLLPSE